MTSFIHLKVSKVFLVYWLIGFSWILLNKFVTMEAMELNANLEMCTGKHHMPLDVERIKAEDRVYDEFKFEHFDSMPESTTLSNNGHTLEIEMDFHKDMRPTISHGPFNGIGRFSFKLLYFHWLEKSRPEYDYRDISFPAELHLVFCNTNYSTISNAWNKENGIAILSYPIKVAPYASSYFDPIMPQLKMIRGEGEHNTIPYDTQIPLLFFMYAEILNYFTYHGSTPILSCARDVIWVDFLDHILFKPEFVKEVEQMRSGNRALMSQIVQFETPKGPVFLSNRSQGEDNFSSIPFVDAIDAAVTTLVSVTVNVFLVFLVMIMS